MSVLAIKGHATRGKEVIEILEMLGGQTDWCTGTLSHCAYFINKANRINYTVITDEAFFTLEEFLEKFPYKVGDKVLLEGIIKIIKQVCWDAINDEVIYKLETNIRGFSEEYYVHHYDLQPYKEETMESKPNLLQQLKEYFDNTPRDILEKEWNELSYLNEIGPTVNEYLECVKKYRQSNQYPKTYGECCKILGCKANNFFTSFDYNGCDVEISEYENKADDLLQFFRKLRYCRDAYWKIAGEQMGLGKPWSPSKNDNVYCIFRFKGEIVKDNFVFADSLILEFPTEEMRDAFFENFKELIEHCKELL